MIYTDRIEAQSGLKMQDSALFEIQCVDKYK